MTDLIIHIGIEKTGTSTLQSYFFSHLENYLGISKRKECLSNSNYEIRWFYNLFKKFVYGEKIYEEATHFAHHIKQLQEDFGSVNHNLLLSYEQLCNPILNNVLNFPFLEYKPLKVFDIFPIVDFLKYISNNIWSYGKIRPILTLRKQDELLASLYSQMSNRICYASQKDFESRLNKYFESSGAYIDWSKWVSDLYKEFAQEDVCVLLLEDMSSLDFWHNLSKFVGINKFSKDELLQLSSMIKNSRQVTPNSWQIRPIKAITRHTLKRKWPASHDSYLRHLTFGMASCIDTFYCPLLRISLKSQRDREISLTPDLRERINSYIAPFNERLSKQLSKDLTHLGYYNSGT